MATKQKVSMPKPGWIFFWIFSIILFIFLCFHHGNYDVEDMTPLKFQKSQPAPLVVPASGRITNEITAEKSGGIVANMETSL